jgi:hypothetical protein
MRRFWIWCDKLQEPWRLIFCLIFVGVSIGAISFGNEWRNPYLMFGGVIFLLLGFWSRTRFLYRESKSKGFKISGRRL